MTRAYISAALREVTERADARCEYCRFPQDASLLAFEVEHIVAEKHGGATVADNLALACPYCNADSPAQPRGSGTGAPGSDTDWPISMSAGVEREAGGVQRCRGPALTRR